MRKQVYRYTKDDYVFVYEILSLRSQGMSYVKIGEMFNKHHSTFIHWCKRFDITVGSIVPQFEEFDSVINKKQLPNKYKYKHLIEEPINIGKKCYADYLVGVKKRK